MYRIFERMDGVFFVQEWCRNGEVTDWWICNKVGTHIFLDGQGHLRHPWYETLGEAKRAIKRFKSGDRVVYTEEPAEVPPPVMRHVRRKFKREGS